MKISRILPGFVRKVLQPPPHNPGRRTFLRAGLAAVAVACGGPGIGPLAREIAGDGGLGITPEAGVRPSAFEAPDGGIEIPAGDGGTEGAASITLTGERFTKGTVVIEIPLIQEPGLQKLNLRAVIATDPTLIDPSLPCVDGLVRLTRADSDGGAAYVSDPADPNTRAPLYVVGYTLIDNAGGNEAVEYRVSADQIRYLGASCAGAAYAGTPEAAAFETPIPAGFYRDNGAVNATLRLTVVTEPDKFVPGFEHDYQTRFTAVLRN